jgi:hypothetical protein
LKIPEQDLGLGGDFSSESSFPWNWHMDLHITKLRGLH